MTSKKEGARPLTKEKNKDNSNKGGESSSPPPPKKGRKIYRKGGKLQHKIQKKLKQIQNKGQKNTIKKIERQKHGYSAILIEELVTFIPDVILPDPKPTLQANNKSYKILLYVFSH